ncbi:MAG: peroxidase family protein [Sphingorhabdus sp.]
MYSSALKPFVFNATDLEFILRQINFRPLFDADGNAIINWDGTGAIFDGHANPIWDGYSDLLDADGNVLWDNVDGDNVLTTDEINAAAVVALNLYGPSFPSTTSSYGLRDVAGLNNNLNLVNSTYGTVDQPFLRTVAAQYEQNSHGHVYVTGEAGFEAGTDQFGNAVYADAYWANNAFANAFGGAGGFSGTHANGATTNYAITQDLTDPENPVIVMDNIVDYTPRMISLLTTTGGVNFQLDGNGHIDYTNGVATVADWGMLQSLGIQDAQARFAGTPGEGEYFIGAQNPGVSPTNGWFTIFGQFFDHGLDFIDKGAQGKTIKIAFAADDPLYGVTGSDGRPATSITISRANVAGFDADGNPEYLNHTSPFIDQSQTYGSDAAVTEFLREWVLDPVTGMFKAGMNMLNGHTLAEAWTKPDGTLTHETLPTLNELRAHAVATGRDDISWNDVFNFHNSGQALILDMNPRFDAANLLSSTGFNDANHNGTQDIGEDTYVGFNDLNGNGIQDGAETTQAQDVLDAIAYLGNVANGAIRASDSFGLVGDDLTLVLGSSLPVDENPMHDIPAGTYTGANAMMLWVNFANMSVMSTSAIDYLPATEAVTSAVGTLLLASVGDHYIAGDGRVNENFGLTTVHHVFHEEHNFQIENLKAAIYREADARNGAMADGQYDAEYMKQFQKWDATDVTWNATTGNYEKAGEIAWDLDVMFQAAKMTVEMEYQHVAIDQYARTVTPDIKEFVGYTNSEDPTVSLEYAQSIFRFGHSQLRETIDTIDPDHGLTGKITGYALKLAFLNPDEFADLGPAAIALGMTHQQGNEIDEFITPALNQGLLGLPLDLAAINIARGRDVGIPALNEFRTAVGLEAYTGWTDFGANMGHPDNLVNFIAAYSFDGDVGKAEAIMALNEGTYADTAEAVLLAESLGLVQDAMSDADFEAYASDYAFNFMNGGDRGVDMIDTWLGGLAEVHVTGGLLGETFNLVFVDQMERLQDGDRFYYLYRLVNQQFADEIGGGQFKDIIERNTGLTHMGGSAFSYNDQYYDLGATRDDTNTVNNNHKYGNLINAVGNTMGIYSDGGNTQSRDGQTINVRITDPVTGVVTNKQFIRDTRVTDPNAPNGGLGIDGTDNSGAESTEVIVGTKYDDFIYARGGDDTVYGDGGNDIIYGGNGIDRLYGGDGKDRIIGGDGAELADGGAGDDYIAGDSSATAAAGVDQLMGGMGNDEIHGGIGIDKLAGGGGDDRIFGEGETDPFTHGGDGNDFIDGGITGDNLYGDNGDDVIVGGADQDILYGGNGDDILRPGNPSQALGGGPDEVLGGDGVTDNGFDMIDFSDNVASANGIAFDLLNQANPQVQIDGTTPVPASTQIEAITGSNSNDTLTGDANDNWLIGGTGSDKFVGGAGDDIIIGGTMRLDEVIGKYQTAYNHNNNNDNANATGIEDVGLTHTGIYTQEQMDQLYQGASNRVAWDDALDNSGLIDAANTQLGGADYEKHFTEMLRSKQFQDLKLGDGGSDAAGVDTLILSGNPNNYTIEQVNFAGHNVLRITSAATGSDLVADVEKFQFGTAANAPVFTFAQMVTPPAISVSDVTVVEGDVGTTNAVFAVSLDHIYPHDITVTYTTADGTAAAGSDYVAATGTVTIPAGQLSANVTTVVNGDLSFEGDETYTVDLSAPTNGATLADAQGVATIDDGADAPPTMSVADVTVVEGTSGTNYALVTVALNIVSGLPISVSYALAGDTALAGTDFDATGGSVTINPGNTSATFLVPITTDALYEDAESFGITISSGDTLNASATATATITDDDAKPALTVDSVTVDEGGVATITVSLDVVAGKDIVIDYAAVDGTAVSPDDYALATGTLTIPAGSLTATLVVNAAQDAVYEGVEAYSVNFSSADTSNSAASTATIQIDPADVMPEVSISDPVAVTEGGATSLVFTVSLNQASGLPVTLDFATADGTAAAGLDYTATSGVLTIAAGQTSATITVPVLDDALYEATAETLSVSLSNVAGATVAAASATGTINDNEALPTLSVSGATVVEGNAGTTNMVFTVTLSGASASAITVDYAAADGTATLANNDFQSLAGSLTFNPGDPLTQTVTVAINGDIQLEANETVALGLSNAIGAAIGASTAGTITNDDTHNQVVGTAGPDVLTGSASPDNMTGLAGNDRLVGSAGADILDGGANVDTVDYSGATGGVLVNLGTAGGGANGPINAVRETALTTGTVTSATAVVSTDTLVAIENAIGSAFGDRLVGSAGANVFTPGAGADAVLGQAGIDTVDYSTASGAVHVNLPSNWVHETAVTAGTVTAATPWTTQDSLSGIENVIGSGFGDFIQANGSNNTINGGNGNDNIQAGSGDDVITQSSTGGRDFINGGANGVAGDTFELVGDASAENFVIYTRVAAIAAGFGVGLNAATQIVITRQVGAGPQSVISELTGIEEIKVLTSANAIGALAGSNANNPTPGSTTNVVTSGDSIRVVGDFTTTSLRYNTITVEGSMAKDTVDISGLTSAHRVVFNTNGGGDVFVGNQRPQDVVGGGLADLPNNGSPEKRSAIVEAVPALDNGWLQALSSGNLGSSGLGRSIADVPAYEELAPLARKAGSALSGVLNSDQGPVAAEHHVENWLWDDHRGSQWHHDNNGHWIP